MLPPNGKGKGYNIKKKTNKKNDKLHEYKYVKKWEAIRKDGHKAKRKDKKVNVTKVTDRVENKVENELEHKSIPLTGEQKQIPKLQDLSWDTPAYRWGKGEELPEGWDYEEATAGLEARIEQCERRILQNIMPYYFKLKKSGLEEQLNRTNSMIDAEPGLPFDVVRRLEHLKTIKKHLEEKKDPCKELPNVNAIISAYRSKELIWNGKATYWRGGILVAGPQDFSWEDFKKLNGNNTGEGFWVEGRNGPGPQQCYYYSQTNVFDTAPNGMTHFTLSTRFSWDMDVEPPGWYTHGPIEEFVFSDDTGCTCIMMLKDDMVKLMGPNASMNDYPWPQIMGYSMVSLANGSENLLLCVALDFNIKDKDGNYMLTLDPSLVGNQQAEWPIIDTYVNDLVSTQPGAKRLCGGFLRGWLYQATAPERPGHIYFSNTREGLTEQGMLPAIPPDRRAGAQIWLPGFAAGWIYDWEGVKRPVPRNQHWPRAPLAERPLRYVADNYPLDHPDSPPLLSANPP